MKGRDKAWLHSSRNKKGGEENEKQDYNKADSIHNVI
jgi:hypothetical protein